MSCDRCVVRHACSHDEYNARRRRIRRQKEAARRAALARRPPKLPALDEFRRKLGALLNRIPWNDEFLSAALAELRIPFLGGRMRIKAEKLSP